MRCISSGQCYQTWLDEFVKLTIKPLNAFFSLIRYRPSVDVILMCLMSMLNLKEH